MDIKIKDISVHRRSCLAGDYFYLAVWVQLNGKERVVNLEIPAHQYFDIDNPQELLETIISHIKK